MTRRKDPLIIELDAETLPEAPTPAEAPPMPDTADTGTARAIAVSAPRARWGIGGLLLSAAGGLILLWLGVSATEFVQSLFAQWGWLGWVGTGLLGLFLVVAVLLIVREVAALSRLRRIETLRQHAERADQDGSDDSRKAVLRGLDRLYGGRADLEWARASLASAAADTPDAAGRLLLAERTLMAPLDEAAQQSVMRAARNVATATALIPMAAADVIAALTFNLRMIREISELYGGRAGWIGSWRLMRAVASHLIATGAVAVADDLLGPMVGGGVLGKLSRRFGEGAVNGTLTARVGVAAIEICRPLPFRALEPPTASALVLRALRAWRQDGRGENGAGGDGSSAST